MKLVTFNVTYNEVNEVPNSPSRFQQLVCVAMLSAKVRPMMEFDWPEEDTSDTESGASHGRHRQDYLARQAFLRSYQFTVKESLPEKVKRRLVQIAEAAVDVARWVQDEVHVARVRFRASQRLRLPSPRCFRSI